MDHTNGVSNPFPIARIQIQDGDVQLLGGVTSYAVGAKTALESLQRGRAPCTSTRAPGTPTRAPAVKRRNGTPSKPKKPRVRQREQPLTADQITTSIVHSVTNSSLHCFPPGTDPRSLRSDLARRAKPHLAKFCATQLEGLLRADIYQLLQESTVAPARVETTR